MTNGLKQRLINLLEQDAFPGASGAWPILDPTMTFFVAVLALELHDRETGDFLKMTEIRCQHRKAER
jgi:hypothetical protein